MICEAANLSIFRRRQDGGQLPEIKCWSHFTWVFTVCVWNYSVPVGWPVQLRQGNVVHRAMLYPQNPYHLCEN